VSINKQDKREEPDASRLIGKLQCHI